MSPCRSGERLAVEDRTREGDLKDLYRELAQRPGRAIFVEFSGRQDGKTLIAERLIRASAEGPGCREDLARVRLRAHGADPLWQLEAREDGVLVRLRGGQPPVRFPAGGFERKGRLLVYEGVSEKSVLRITLHEERCRDAMLGITTLRAVAELEGNKYSGCAWRGDLEKTGSE